jgi:hypothetical protein
MDVAHLEASLCVTGKGAEFFATQVVVRVDGQAYHGAPSPWQRQCIGLADAQAVGAGAWSHHHPAFEGVAVHRAASEKGDAGNQWQQVAHGN